MINPTYPKNISKVQIPFEREGYDAHISYRREPCVFIMIAIAM